MPKKNNKLWGGRFRSKSLQQVDEFNASVNFDYLMASQDIAGSIAHAKMLAKRKILKASEAKKIIQGLETIRRHIQAGRFSWQLEKEDVHLNIESALIDLVGAVGGKLHTARSRNDQVATDLRLYTRERVAGLIGDLRELQKSLVRQAEQNIEVLLPGYTHLQRAQPISLAHYLLAYFEMFERDVTRLQDASLRANVLPLGAGALAGTTFPIDRHFVASELEFAEVSHNSLDAVSDRDFALEILSALAIIAMHLSRIAEEWILWSTQEFQFVRLPEQFCTGSSMMPQKINPDVLELIRGKTGRVYGSLMTLLTVMKGLPLAYNKDMQEDKEPLFDALKTVSQCLQILAPLVESTRFNAKKMKAALGEGYVLATDLADYLSTRGVPFRDAHRVVGEIVAFCQARGLELKELKLNELKRFHPKFSADVSRWLDEGHSVDRRSAVGGTARKNVRNEIKRAQKILKNKPS